MDPVEPVEPAETFTAEELQRRLEAETGEVETGGTSAAAGASDNPLASKLLAKLQQRTATIGIIGQGYVGLPLALLFAEEGFSVVGFDVDPAKVEMLNRGESYIRHIGPIRVRCGGCRTPPG